MHYALDKVIIKTINSIVQDLDKVDSQTSILDNLNDLEIYVQLLLKAEWDKSKIEAKTGKLETDL
ncbi:hypothetical protein AB4158_03265 [Vibrio splendidus]